MRRIKKQRYRPSFKISLSHALIHTRMAIAAGHALESPRRAYDTTKKLLGDVARLDITGEYEGFIRLAHAEYAKKIGKIAESRECLMRVAAVYLHYNQPYMIKLALNHLSSYVKNTLPAAYKMLCDREILDAGMIAHDTSVFMANSAVDLENSFLKGLDYRITHGDMAAAVVPQNGPRENNLRVVRKTYDHWHKITRG